MTSTTARQPDVFSDTDTLNELGEHFAAGFFEHPRQSASRRMARGVRRHLERRRAQEWSGQELYPAGAYSIWQGGQAVSFGYSRSMRYSAAACRELGSEHPHAEAALQALDAALSQYPMVGSDIAAEFHLGGAGYTHSIPNFGRVAREGLDQYQSRLEQRLDRARHMGETDAEDLCLALLDVLLGIRAWHANCLHALQSAAPDSPQAEERAERLLAALERVPFGPARSFYEALISANFIFYLDGCDSLGRIDQDLGPYYDTDLSQATLSDDQGTHWVRQLWENVDANSGWNVALGGTDASGQPAYNGFTRAALRAAHGMRRPNLALRLRRDTPREIYDLALDAIASGCGIPALYNEEGYLDALRAAHLNIRDSDLADYAFGGCTETMVHGASNVGSLDAGINLLQILTETLDRSLVEAADFGALMQEYRNDLRDAIARLAAGVSSDQRAKAQWQPQPMRSLLIDDCIDAGVEYNAGGARYNWSVINVGGLANVIDSLAATRQLVFKERVITGTQLRQALRADFSGHESLRQQLASCPRFGNDDPQADELATELSTFVFEELRQYAPWRGGRFLPGCLMFVTYAGAGEGVMASPDGRRAGAPIADSAGPYQGRDGSGPTAMLRSVTAIAQRLAPGTLVVNTRFSRQSLSEPDQRSRLIDLIRTYFDLGGMQLQINVVDQAVLQDAIDHPQDHEDLIVRIGGYSEYFNRLSPALKETLLERTEHS
jgi:pyruvate-formate lyase